MGHNSRWSPWARLLALRSALSCSQNYNGLRPATVFWRTLVSKQLGLPSRPNKQNCKRDSTSESKSRHQGGLSQSANSPPTGSRGPRAARTMNWMPRSIILPLPAVTKSFLSTLGGRILSDKPLPTSSKSQSYWWEVQTLARACHTRKARFKGLAAATIT